MHVALLAQSVSLVSIFEHCRFALSGLQDVRICDSGSPPTVPTYVVVPDAVLRRSPRDA